MNACDTGNSCFKEKLNELISITAQPERRALAITLGEDYFLDDCVDKLQSGRFGEALLALALRLRAELGSSEAVNNELIERFMAEADYMARDCGEVRLITELESAIRQ